jgi:hypothetical protein
MCTAYRLDIGLRHVLSRLQDESKLPCRCFNMRSPYIDFFLIFRLHTMIKWNGFHCIFNDGSALYAPQSNVRKLRQ